jgi:alanine-synthesizing transaminase
LYRFSRRLSWTSLPNELSELIRQKREAAERLLDLTISNPTEALEDYPHEQVAGALGRVRDLTYRPDPAGQQPARRAIAGYYAARNIAIEPERLLLTASTSEAYALLFKLFSDPEQDVLAPLPSYPLFEYLAAAEGARVAPYRLRYDGSWYLDFESLRRSISPRTRAIVVVNPNNPTGSFLKRREVDELFALAAEHELPIISDEVFMDYEAGDGDDRVRSLIGNRATLTFSLNGLSKAAGMPQMKLAWIGISGPEAACQTARQRLELLSDTYLSVNTPVQCALPELLRIGSEVRERIARHIAQNRSALNAALEDTAAHCLHIEGGWTAILQLPSVMDEETWIKRLLAEHNVIVQPGYFFDMDSEAYAVVSLITRPALFREGVQRLKELIDKIGSTKR